MSHVTDARALLPTERDAIRMLLSLKVELGDPSYDFDLEALERGEGIDLADLEDFVDLHATDGQILELHNAPPERLLAMVRAWKQE